MPDLARKAMIEAVADAWASIDGKLDDFRAGKGKNFSEQPGGRYYGYLEDAKELVARIEKRGFCVKPLKDES